MHDAEKKIILALDVDAGKKTEHIVQASTPNYVRATCQNIITLIIFSSSI